MIAKFSILKAEVSSIIALSSFLLMMIAMTSVAFLQNPLSSNTNAAGAEEYISSGQKVCTKPFCKVKLASDKLDVSISSQDKSGIKITGKLCFSSALNSGTHQGMVALSYGDYNSKSLLGNIALAKFTPLDLPLCKDNKYLDFTLSNNKKALSQIPSTSCQNGQMSLNLSYLNSTGISIEEKNFTQIQLKCDSVSPPEQHLTPQASSQPIAPTDKLTFATPYPQCYSNCSVSNPCTSGLECVVYPCEKGQSCPNINVCVNPNCKSNKSCNCNQIPLISTSLISQTQKSASTISPIPSKQQIISLAPTLIPSLAIATPFITNIISPTPKILQSKICNECQVEINSIEISDLQKIRHLPDVDKVVIVLTKNDQFISNINDNLNLQSDDSDVLLISKFRSVNLNISQSDQFEILLQIPSNTAKNQKRVILGRSGKFYYQSPLDFKFSLSSAPSTFTIQNKNDQDIIAIRYQLCDGNVCQNFEINEKILPQNSKIFALDISHLAKDVFNCQIIFADTSSLKCSSMQINTTQNLYALSVSSVGIQSTEKSYPVLCDIDKNLDINSIDIAKILSAWSSDFYSPELDINGDEKVGATDFAICREEIGNSPVHESLPTITIANQ